MSSPAQDAHIPTEQTSGTVPTEQTSGTADEPARPSRPRRMVTIGLVALVICAVAGAGAVVAAVVTHGFHSKATVKYRQAAVFSMRVGDCIDLTPNGDAVRVVPCAGSHDAEVFGTFQLGGTWPGNAKAQQEAAAGCGSRLSGYLNPQLAATNLGESYVYPGQQAWATGEHTVVCEVRATSGTLSGSVRSGG